VLENPVAYYADADPELLGQLRAPALAEDLERLTGLPVERRAEGVALVDTSGRLSDIRFPGGGTVAQAALLLGARISAAVQRTGRHALELLPAPTAAERLAARARRIDRALPSRGVTGVTGVTGAITELGTLDEELAYAELAYGASGAAEAGPDAGPGEAPGEIRYPFVTGSWLRGRLKEIIGEYGAGFSADLRGDPDRLLDQALSLLAAMSLIARVDGGALVLPLLARYRGVTARVKTRQQSNDVRHTPERPAAQTALFDDDTDHIKKDPTP
jgi:hypothetical protein